MMVEKCSLFLKQVTLKHLSMTAHVVDKDSGS